LRFERGSPTPASVVEIPGRSDIAVVSPDGSKLALGFSGLTIVLDARSGAVISALRGYVGDPTGLAFSRAGDRLFAAAADGTLRIFDVPSGALVTTTYVFDDGEWLTM